MRFWKRKTPHKGGVKGVPGIVVRGAPKSKLYRGLESCLSRLEQLRGSQRGENNRTAKALDYTERRLTQRGEIWDIFMITHQWKKKITHFGWVVA